MEETMQQSRSPQGRRRVTVRARLPWVLVMLLVVGTMAAWRPSRAWGETPEIVARVNGDPVTREEVQRLLADPRARRQLEQELGVPEPDNTALERLAVRKLIKYHLLLQEASRRDITVTEEDLSRATVALRRRFKNLKSFGAWLHAQGLDDSSLRETLRTQILTSRVMAALAAGVRLTEEQMQGYYEAYKDDLQADEEVRLRIVAVPEKAAAEELVAAVQRGEDVDRLAQERSLKVLAAPGADEGWIRAQTLPPALREVVSTLQVGETGGPVQSGAEFLLVRVEERRSAHMMSLAEAQPQIQRRLLAAKQRKVVQAWLTDQEKQAQIEVLP
jgi:parvulin-like peptidyl-prolyl isomerase